MLKVNTQRTWLLSSEQLNKLAKEATKQAQVSGFGKTHLQKMKPEEIPVLLCWPKCETTG